MLRIKSTELGYTFDNQRLFYFSPIKKSLVSALRSPCQGMLPSVDKTRIGIRKTLCLSVTL